MDKIQVSLLEARQIGYLSLSPLLLIIQSFIGDFIGE